MQDQHTPLYHATMESTGIDPSKQLGHTGRVTEISARYGVPSGVKMPADRKRKQAKR